MGEMNIISSLRKSIYTITFIHSVSNQFYRLDINALSLSINLNILLTQKENCHAKNVHKNHSTFIKSRSNEHTSIVEIKLKYQYNIHKLSRSELLSLSCVLFPYIDAAVFPIKYLDQGGLNSGLGLTR